MALRDEMIGYFDGNGLVAPHKADPKILKGSDNGTCFSAEYYVMLQKLGQLIPQDCADFQAKIDQCINSEGMLCRLPIGQDDGQEQVDDYYSTLNGCKQLGNTKIPRQYITALIKNFGFMDNVNPGSRSNWASFMPRQPQLLAAIVAAAFPSFSDPLHLFNRLLAMPLFLIAGLTIAFSCRGTDSNDADSRRLCWHLIQTVSPVSLMCFLASKIWYKRLYSTYGSDGMKAVAAKYYEPNHPFIKYWVTE